VKAGDPVRAKRLPVGLVVLSAEPADDAPCVRAAGVPCSWNATTTFAATGAYDGGWVEVRPPGALVRGWLRVSELE
jgi:hypothetical protein